MIDSGFDFVSKCAVNFKDDGFERARIQSVSKTMHSCDRSHDRLSIMGRPGATHEIFAIAEKLSINLQYLLGY